MKPDLEILKEIKCPREGCGLWEQFTLLNASDGLFAKCKCGTHFKIREHIKDRGILMGVIAGMTKVAYFESFAEDPHFGGIELGPNVAWDSVIVIAPDSIGRYTILPFKDQDGIRDICLQLIENVLGEGRAYILDGKDNQFKK